MSLAFAVAGALTTESKFQQYEQATVKPIDVSRLDFGTFFVLPFGYKTFTYSGRGLYINPFYDLFSDVGQNNSEYSPTTYVWQSEYNFKFSGK